MHVVAAGASGLLGRSLCRHLTEQGHQVTRLVRREAGAGESRWDPYAGFVDSGLIADADAVVNLAGSPTAGNPHSKKWARELLQSRVTTTAVLAEAIGRAAAPPVLLAGNGISFYGDHGDDEVTEAAESRGDALLTRVTRQWQAATVAASDAGARVCVLRTAPVMDAAAPPLGPLRQLARLGLSTRLGSGRQYFPMISLRDWVGGVTFALTHEMHGPINLCCPVTPTNAEFTRALADAVRRPAFLAVPAPVIKVAAGAMAPEVLGSLRAVPHALQDAGYRFADHDVRDVIAAGLAR
ncbi:TIGR01777 family oxidoreductase [Nocardioides dubius]|uniref:TIGR01777 family oxidoreductase n=1 Tax=Nocardioides dubius TaxID=317019 RepID=A0ABN1TPH6_9ACTN